MTKQRYEYKNEGDFTNIYENGKLIKSTMHTYRFGDMHIKPSTAANPQRFYNIIIKLYKRLQVLQAEFDSYEFTNGVEVGKYTVYGRGKCSYYDTKKASMFMVKKHDERDPYDGFWTCPENQVMDDYKFELKHKKDKYVALFNKIAEASPAHAEKIAEQMIKKEASNTIRKITRHQKKNANLERAFVVAGNIRILRSYLYKCIDTYADLIIRNKHKKYPKYGYYESLVVLFPEIKKALIVDRSNNNRERLVDMFNGDEIQEQFKGVK